MKFSILLLLVAMLSTAIAFSAVRQEYGELDGAFGPMVYGGDIDASNALRIREESISAQLPIAATPGGTTHDFGVMKMYEKGDHVFTIRNDGEEPLTLRVGAATCKCTLGSLESELLQPGQETQVKLEWTVSTLDDTFEQSAEILTNDPNRIGVRMRVMGTVVRALKMVPDVLTLGERPAGEAIESHVDIFSYFDNDIDPFDARFTGGRLGDLSELTVEEFSPSESLDHSKARQAFRVTFKINSGMPQGPIQQRLVFRFHNEDGSSADDATDDSHADTDGTLAMDWQVTGRIVGVLGMVPTGKLTGSQIGGWQYDFGRLEAGDSLVGRAFVTMKGNERESTNLTVGEVFPTDVVSASLEPDFREGATTSLHRLTITLTPGAESVLRLGKNQDDYGWVVIESDNPKVPSMRVMLIFGIQSAEEREAQLRQTESGIVSDTE